jgi:hypothetical protein
MEVSTCINATYIRACQGSTPPIWQMIAHSSALTGCTDSRVLLTSTIFSSPGVILHSSRLIARFRGLTALIQTQSQRGSSVVESGLLSRLTSTIPTIYLPMFEW